MQNRSNRGWGRLGQGASKPLLLLFLGTFVIVGGFGAFAWKAYRPGSPARGKCCKTGDTTPPLDLIKSTPMGGLHNPYDARIADVAEEGHHLFLSLSCNGCHGGGGGGGICPPLTNDTWIYGASDDTLFRLISLGSDGLQNNGYSRVRHETVSGPMTPFGEYIKTSNDLWKIIAWIRSVNPNSVSKENVPYKAPPKF
jgi:mono/diheme cytochrome c family protein